ncbi:alpha-N-acetylgalactosaminide alpha-2,6-sialyltransferase 1-like [Colossoma macropomum]|uniref:alpha-N-acetylgalactosaminide alpha-2,6-sialyltransferase 1-like n=1 Tax=Colossoma macropomum TaxID=42526 RepID=UPI001864AC3B|nr:alpha-N-acetylgalactosaminide alpha-2,6-sialyltransferase 1-like [Colossoma macropomum]
MRKVLPLIVSLLCCAFFYVLIWNKIQGTWTGPKELYYVASKSGFFWRDRNETTENVTPAIRTPSLNLSSGKTTKSTVKEDVLDSFHHVKSHQEAPLGNHNLTTSVTTLPVLYKKDFKKLPEWDFEDVYTRNNEERHPVCSKSLQKSKDKEFQAAIIPNIQLWLHKGHLNVSEWNRLSHFNNPFGFMEYKYNDVNSSVGLIPKPKFTQLLPVPENAHDGCVRCAVVGTGGILNGSRKGKEIDSHHYVFRMNGAVTKGFEEDVGNKTSVYVHTSYALHQSVYGLKTYGFSSAPKDEGIKYVLIPEGMRDFEWIQGLFQKNIVKKGVFKGFSPLSFYGGRIEKERFYVLHPDFLRYIRNRFLSSKSLNEDYWHLYRPTNGAFTLFLALHTCDIVNVYGFITADHHKYSNYYFDTGVKTSVVFFINHDYNLEIQTWKKLHDSGIINLYQRKENLKET